MLYCNFSRSWQKIKAFHHCLRNLRNCINIWRFLEFILSLTHINIKVWQKLIKLLNYIFTCESDCFRDCFSSLHIYLSVCPKQSFQHLQKGNPLIFTNYFRTNSKEYLLFCSDKKKTDRTIKRQAQSVVFLLVWKNPIWCFRSAN